MKTNSIARIVTTFAAFLAIAGTAAAERKVSQTGKVSVDVPPGWETQAQGDVVLAIKNPDDTVGMLMIVVDKSKVEDVFNELDKAIGGAFTEASWKQPKKIKVGGMAGIAFDGRAKYEGKPVITSVVIAGPTPTNKGVIAIAAIQADQAKAHMKVVVGILKSLRREK